MVGDAHPTCYFAQELAATPLERFEPVDTPENRRLMAEGKAKECLLAYRTKGAYWGKKRAVIVTYNPSSRRKQELLSMTSLRQSAAPMSWKTCESCTKS